MKAFETMDPFDARSYLPTTTTASDLDYSGYRVNAYAKMAMTASIVSKLVKIVPRHGKRFAFMHPRHQEVMETMRIPFRLKENCYKQFRCTARDDSQGYKEPAVNCTCAGRFTRRLFPFPLCYLYTLLWCFNSTNPSADRMEAHQRNGRHEVLPTGRWSCDYDCF